MVSAVAERDALVLDHQGVARAVAIQEARKWKVPADDLCQEAFIGLIIAAERFDPSRGVLFSTYAVWVIRGQIKTAIERERRHSHQKTFTDRRQDTIGRAYATYTSEEMVRLDDRISSDRTETRLDVLESQIPSPEDLHMGRELAAAAELALASAARRRGEVAAAIALNRLAENPRSARKIAKRLGVDQHRVKSIDAEILEIARAML